MEQYKIKYNTFVHERTQYGHAYKIKNTTAVVVKYEKYRPRTARVYYCIMFVTMTCAAAATGTAYKYSIL